MGAGQSGGHGQVLIVHCIPSIAVFPIAAPLMVIVMQCRYWALTLMAGAECLYYAGAHEDVLFKGHFQAPLNAKATLLGLPCGS